MNAKINELLLQLNQQQRVIFAALTCEKLYPLYKEFSHLKKWGNSDVYSNAIVYLYSFALLGEEVKFQDVLYEVESIMPDLDDFTGTAASYALDACSALAEAVAFIIDNDCSHIINCSVAATDIVDMHVQLVDDLDENSPVLNLIINSHSLMMAELQRQESIAISLKKGGVIYYEDIVKIRYLNGIYDIIDLATLT